MVCSKNQSFIQGTLLISTSKYYDYFPLPCQVIFEVLLCLFWADFTCLIFTKILCLYRNKIFRQGKWVKRHKILLNKENFFWCHRPRNINVKNFRTLIFYAKSCFWRKKTCSAQLSLLFSLVLFSGDNKPTFMTYHMN